MSVITYGSNNKDLDNISNNLISNFGLFFLL